MEMKVYLREASDASKEWLDITERCVRPSLKLMEGFSSEGKTEDATELSLTIKALNLTDAASFHTSEKLIRLSMDGTVIFEGYSDGKATVDMGISSSFVHVKVSFSSYMALLEDALAPSGGMAFEGKKIYDPSDTQNSLAHLLADAMYANADELYRDVLADVTDKIVAAADVPACIKTLPIVYIPEGEPIYDVFQDILYENGYSYYFMNRQIRILTPWDTDRNAVSYELQDFISKPTLKQQPLRHRSHLSLRLAEYTAEDDATLYDSGDPDTDEGNPQVIEAGESYPEDGEPEELRYENQEDEDKEIVYSVEPELSYTCVRVSDDAEDHEDWGTDPAPVKVTADIKPTEGTVLFENENSYRIGIQRYRVMASKAYWKRYSTTVKDAVKEGDEEEYSADYIPDTESAEGFIALYHLQEWANNAEVQMQTERMSITPGSLIQITELPYRLLVLSRQTSYENPARPLYKYSMIPLVYIESPADITHSRPGGGGNALRYLFLELSAVYFHYDSDGALAPADQEIEARLTRVNIASEPVWSINGTQVQPSAGNPDRLIISPSYMEGRETVTVSVTCGRFSKSMTIARIQDGKGGQPVQLFQWGESFETRPDDLMEVLVWGDLAITINGWALVTNPGDWETEITFPGPDDKPALWCKFWNYQTNDWGYYVMNGKPSVGFTLEISPQAYRLTSRGYTKAGQSIRAICRRENTNGLPVWSLSDSRLTYSETPGGSGAGDITIPIPEMIKLASFEITCSIGTIGLTKTLIISGVEEGKPETEYLGIFPSVDSLPDSASEGDLILGDHAVVESSDGNRTPYYWTGTQWAMADGNTPVSIAWKILQDTVYDATTAPGTIQSQSIVNLFAQNFAAFNAFIQNLLVQQLRVQNVLYGGDFNADGSMITDPQLQNHGGRGFHFDAQTGLLQAIMAKLFDVEIRSIDAGGKTVLVTYRDTGQGSFEYYFDVTPTCFRKPEGWGISAGEVFINSHNVLMADYASNKYFTDNVAAIGTRIFAGAIGPGILENDGLIFNVQQNCRLGLSISGTASGSLGASLQCYVNNELITTLDFESMSPLDSVVDDVLLPITDVQTGDKIYIRNSYPGNAYRLLFDITITEYIQFASSMDNAFAPVTDPDTAWYEPQASDSEIIPRVIASSKGEYIKVGTASVEGVDVQYAESDTGIISGLSAVFAEGRTYIPSTERTMVWGGISRNISSISRAGSIFTFIFDDGSSAEISDTHTACKIDVEGTAQPSYVDVYRLTVKDPEGMIGTPDQPIPNIYADLYTGGLSYQCFAGYLERASITKPLAVTGSYHMCPRLRWSMLAGSGAIYDSDIRLYSNGFIEISIPLSLSDDTMCKILLPFLFTGDVGVLASGYRDDMLPSDDTPPGMSGTGHDAQFDATYDGAEAVSGSSHQWSRIIGMNDYNSINGCIRVSGYLQETQFNDIMAHSGDLEYLFTS